MAIAAVSLESNNATLRQVTDGLLIGGTVFVIVAGLGAYWLARAALAPVERLRREVAALSERDTGATLRVPGTHDEIAALARTMNNLLVRLRRALARQRAFVADASHELRTPFAVLQGELELAGLPGRSKEELTAAVASAAEEAGRLTRITDDLLLLAKGDEDKLSLRPERTDIAALLTRSAERASARAQAAGVTCRVDAATALTAVVDAGRIRQAVDNLVDNALRFAPRGTQVVISAEITGPSLVIEVRDCGPGFPPEFLPHAFERFRRPDEGRARSAGGAWPGPGDRTGDRRRPRRNGGSQQPKRRRRFGQTGHSLPYGPSAITRGLGWNPQTGAILRSLGDPSRHSEPVQVQVTSTPRHLKAPQAERA